MQLDEFLRQRQPEAGALFGPLTCLRLLELFEDPRLIVRRDADAGVAYRDPHLVVDRPRLDLDRATLTCELHRVSEQVEEDLPDLALVGLDRAHRRIDL